MPPCLTLSIIRYGSKVKWSNPEKGVAPFPHLSVVVIEKGASMSPSTTVAKLNNWLIGLVDKVFTNGPGEYGSRVNWGNPGKGVALFPTPRCSS